MKRILLAGLAIGFLLFIYQGIANADISGDTINWQYYTYGSAYNHLGSPGSFVVGSTSSTFADTFDLSGNSNQIIFDYTPSGSGDTWSPSSVSYNTNGLYITNGLLLTDNTSSFVSVTVDPLSNMAGFSDANVTFDNNDIAIDWQNLSYNSKTKVILDVNSGSSSVPEPTTILLFGTGLVGLAGFVRRKRK